MKVIRNTSYLLVLVFNLLSAKAVQAQAKNLYTSPISQQRYDIYKTAQTFPQKEFNGERRFALVIGVSEYQFVSRLSSCYNDAEAIKNKLLEAGFDVMLINNSPSLAKLRSLVEDAEKYYLENNYNIALVYYSGHGVQLGELNWLVPKDLQFINWSNISQSQAISLLSKSCMRYGELIQPFVRLSKTRQVIGILDACRSYDYMAAGSKSVTNEFATLLNNEAQIMGDDKLSRIFSSKAGKVSIAKHPESDYSYFTHYLLKCFNPSQSAPSTLVDLKRELNKLMEGSLQNSLIYPAPGSYEFRFYKFGKPSTSPSPQPAADQLTDIDGNTYKTVQIGNQYWMAENLKTSRYNDGSVIPNVKENEKWRVLESGAWCNYDNRAVQDDPMIGDKLGKLYNWYVVSDPKKLCPAGWHVPSDDEWTILTNYLGGNVEAEDKMKSTFGWESEGKSGNGSNKSGFNGLPGGFRFETYENSDDFTAIGEIASFWSSSESSTTQAWDRTLQIDRGEAERIDSEKRSGLSVRCLRN
jgi:uncharacterized protein (TIGR02145 family)